jgi:hypothetical protein
MKRGSLVAFGRDRDAHNPAIHFVIAALRISRAFQPSHESGDRRRACVREPICGMVSAACQEPHAQRPTRVIAFRKRATHGSQPVSIITPRRRLPVTRVDL